MLMLVDAATLYYRAFHALPSTLTDSQGRPNNAIRGFFDGLRILRDAYRPTSMVACWDEDWRPQWRVDLLPSYKTKRAESGEELPSALAAQAPVIAEVCRALGIAVIGASGMEADDVVAALALAAREPVAIVSGDRDLTQLVSDANDRTLVYLGTGVGKHTMYDDALVFRTYGVRPDQYADLAALRGDPSDGIPGARGIGAKTAAAYVTAFTDLEGVLEAAATETPPISKAKAQILVEQDQLLRASKRVIQLQPGALELPALQRDSAALARLTAEYGLGSVIARWDRAEDTSA